MSDEAETPARPRTSRFKEHTNTASSIKPPPDELWKDLGTEDMIDQYNEENSKAPTKRKNKSISPPAFVAPAAPAHDGPFGRFSRAWASVFEGLGSVLGKRKANNVDAEKDRERSVLDERREAADQAYQARKLAQEQGLLPTPKVFIRPTATPRSHKCAAEHTTVSSTPRVPSLHHTPSKKDLQKQMKLTKRVSDLEFKLASARKELQNVLHKDMPPVPPLPTMLPPTPTPETSQSTHVFSDKENENTQDTQMTSPESSQKSVGKITKKRKAITEDDETYKPVPTDSEGDLDISTSEPERTIKRVRSTSSRKGKRGGSKLTKRRSRGEMKAVQKDEAIRVVPDGKSVPPLPRIPSGVKGKKTKVSDDGYGGLEHEMF